MILLFEFLPKENGADIFEKNNLDNAPLQNDVQDTKGYVIHLLIRYFLKLMFCNEKANHIFVKCSLK